MKKNKIFVACDTTNIQKVKKNIKMIDIYHAIDSRFNNSKSTDGNDIRIIFSDDNASELILLTK